MDLEEALLRVQSAYPPKGLPELLQRLTEQERKRAVEGLELIARATERML